MVINQNSKVTLHFALHTEGDVEVDSTFEKSPATFVMGDGSLLPGFEKVLLGLQAGDEKSFILPPTEAFGEHNADSVHVIEKHQFGAMELAEGLVVSFNGAGKLVMPGVIKKMDGENVTVDFNHPLAGQHIRFKVRIIDVVTPLSLRDISPASRGGSITVRSL